MEQELLNDLRFGETVEIIEIKLIKARRVCKIINMAGFCLSMFIFISPSPSQFFLLLAICLPLIGIYKVLSSGGMIQFNQRDGVDIPNVTRAILSPSFLLFFSTIEYNSILDHSSVWSLIFSLTILLFSLIIINRKGIKIKKLKDLVDPIVIIWVLFLYSYGTVIYFNCNYDDSKAIPYTSRVTGKWISSRDKTNYYLSVKNFGPNRIKEEVFVKEDLYKGKNIGDHVIIYYKKGKFDIPSYYVKGK